METELARIIITVLWKFIPLHHQKKTPWVSPAKWHNDIFPTKQVKITEIEVTRKIYSGSKISLIRCMILFWTLLPLYHQKQNSVIFTTQKIIQWRVLNNMFALNTPKSSTYSTAMNMRTHILLKITLHSCGYEHLFTKLYIHLSVKVSESLSLQMQIIHTRINLG